MKKIIKEYTMLRIILTILVVIGHCEYFVIKTNYGGCDYGYMTSDLSVIYKISMMLVSYIYTFHMPLYIALSGAIFSISMNNKKQLRIKELIISKANRLLFPFIAVTLLYCVPVKYMSGYFDEVGFSVKNIVIGQILLQGNTHLWFLPTLFFCFIIVFVIERLFSNYKNKNYVIFFALLVCWIISEAIKINIVSKIMQYCFWFYFGYLFNNKRETLNKYISANICVLLGIVSVFLFLVRRYFGDDLNYFINKVSELILIFSGCAYVYGIAYILSTKIYRKRIVSKLSDYSFGIYLYSDPVNYICLFVFTQIFSDKLFSSNVYSLLFIGMRFVSSLIISILITWGLKKAKFKALY